MFYSHPYLRRNGRFGLIWIAATKPRTLSRREIASINVARTTCDILEHVPGDAMVVNRHHRFSLYLSAQLMYGSVKVLQKQCDYLLIDLAAMLRKFHVEINPTTEIDLVCFRPEPVTIESCVPTKGIGDKHYDPYFGSFKRYDTSDEFEALMALWDRDYVHKEKERLQDVVDTSIVKLELGSPHCVTDICQITILDDTNSPSIQSILDNMALCEADLPNLDAHQLAMIQEADKEFDLYKDQQDVTHPQTRDLSHLERPVEQTPAVKITGGQPGTPQKPKRKRRDIDDDSADGKRQNVDVEAMPNGETDQTINEVSAIQNVHEVFEMQEISVENMPRVQQIAPREEEQIANHIQGEQGQEQGQDRTNPPHEEPQFQSPEKRKRTSRDWMDKNPKFQLAPLTPSPSPLRKRRPHKLMIDSSYQLSREDMKRNIATASDTWGPLVLPERHKKDHFAEPGSSHLNHPSLKKLFTRNCKFGIKVFDTDNDSSQSSRDSPLNRQTHSVRAVDRSDDPLQQSTEKARETSVNSAKNLSHRSLSFVGEISDVSNPNVSVDQAHISNDMNIELQEQQKSLEPLLEEQSIGAEISRQSIVPEIQQNEIPMEVPMQSSAELDLFGLVQRHVRQTGDWVTFGSLAPPSTTTKKKAAKFFFELCHQIANQTVCVRQDEPYGEIYIYIPDEVTR